MFRQPVQTKSNVKQEYMDIVFRKEIGAQLRTFVET